MMRVQLFGGFLLLAMAQPAWAAIPEAATPVEGLMVEVSKTPPSVVSTFPAQGAAIGPGVLVLKVAYDQTMDAEAWSFKPPPGGALPDCLARPRLLDDRKTFVLLCTVGANGSFGVDFQGGAEGAGFANSGGRAALPYQLSFSTHDWSGSNNLKDALALAGLRPQDNPVMSSKPGAR